jgi:hypothetical protein
MQRITLEAQAAVKSGCNIAGFERAAKDLRSSGMESFKSRIASRSHWSFSFSHLVEAFCNGPNCSEEEWPALEIERLGSATEAAKPAGNAPDHVTRCILPAADVLGTSE